MEPVQPSIVSQTSSVQKKGSKLPIIILIILILVGVGIFMMMRKGKTTQSNDLITPLPTALPTSEVVESPTPEATPSAEPTSKPSPTTKPPVKSAYDMNIQILNGNGTVGVATKAEDFLKGKGYKYFETGNADNYDYSGVSIKIKSSMNQYLSTLQNDLSSQYTVASDSGTLSNDAIFDAVLTIGK